ncbi:glycerophosphocholine phosphodiesterase GPCPD1 [Lethenteron reissneri]|uniref:glycerophosphocholine phosphodiesterase GPCPD1 n=1 Tax=Lethenteron reissneri TaxID=7753 RepID=UPI002AB78A5B|nr:glycerophosphocholine phosphodiesterase GPCPD1 [Lethenteron reissneri]
MVPSQVTFLVRADTLPGEALGLCGDSQDLGSWKSENSITLHQELPDSNIWTVTVPLPSVKTVHFRFFKGCFYESKTKDGSKLVTVNKWETHLHPREFTPTGANCSVDGGHFGIVNGVTSVDIGWLTCQTELRLRLHFSTKPPVLINKKKFKNSRFRVKLTIEGTEEDDDSENYTEAECTQTENPKVPLSLEISLISQGQYKSRHSQPECGYALEPSCWMEYMVHTVDPGNLELTFDFFEEDLSERVVQSDALPGLVGTACLLSSTLMETSKSNGVISLPIMGRNTRQTIGKVNVDYFIIHPAQDLHCDMKASFSKYWKPRQTLDIGHRGAGISYFTEKLAKVRENTITSFKNAASHGAAYVELDVHLSKDLVPVVYHDFTCCISMKKRHMDDQSELLEIPVRELTYQQLQMLKLAHAHAKKVDLDHDSSLNDSHDVPETQSFPTLDQVFEGVPEHVGFDIEIKWPLQQKNGVWEGNLSSYFDMNQFVDIILSCVQQQAKTRRIIYSSFDANICAMVRLKQNKYPVLFLTQGMTEVYPEFMDIRTRSTQIAVHFAQAENILGISAHTEDLLRNPTYIVEAKSKGLVIFGWGNDTNVSENRHRLKELGMDGLIYDRIYDSKPEEANTFQVEELNKVTEGVPLDVIIHTNGEDAHQIS